jgi:hypothetical protein
MSKIKIKETVLISCKTEEEVKEKRKFMRTQGYRAPGPIHFNFWDDKYQVSMYGNWKTYKTI